MRSKNDVTVDGGVDLYESTFIISSVGLAMAHGPWGPVFVGPRGATPSGSSLTLIT
jgi:hypothetical protein